MVLGPTWHHTVLHALDQAGPLIIQSAKLGFENRKRCQAPTSNLAATRAGTRFFTSGGQRPPRRQARSPDPARLGREQVGRRPSRVRVDPDPGGQGSVWFVAVAAHLSCFTAARRHSGRIQDPGVVRSYRIRDPGVVHSEWIQDPGMVRSYRILGRLWQHPPHLSAVRACGPAGA